MCKAYGKVTHIKQQKYFHHLKGGGYNKYRVLYPRPLRLVPKARFFNICCWFSQKFGSNAAIADYFSAG